MDDVVNAAHTMRFLAAGGGAAEGDSSGGKNNAMRSDAAPLTLQHEGSAAPRRAPGARAQRFCAAPPVVPVTPASGRKRCVAEAR
jgi:hypothetical protein